MTTENTSRQAGAPDQGKSSCQEKHSESNSIATDGQIISYNIDEGQRPDGIKVRFKIRVVTGKHAAAVDERQAEAIRELLEWTRARRTPPPPSR